MRLGVSNPLRILRLIDANLTQPLDLVIYGRGAIALGYSHPKVEHQATNDVDAIIPASGLEAFRQNEDFWRAQEQVNRQLESEKLFVTHIFSDEDVIIRPGWERDKVVIASGLSKLRVFRPSTLDLILTKMMRDDPQDLADIEFLLSREPRVAAQIPGGIAQARIPTIPELVEQFERMKPKVLKLVGVSSPQSNSPPRHLFGDL